MPGEADIPTQVALDAEGRVVKDLACIQCGYNLRTLHRDAKCPECGVVVGRSVRGDWLRYADPAWLGNISAGLAWIVRAIVLFLLFMVFALVTALVAGAVGGKGGTVIGIVMSVVLELAMLVAVIGGVGGLWAFTTPEPSPIGPASDLDPRRLVRLSGCAGLIAILAMLSFGESSSGPVLRPIAALLLLAWCAVVLIYVRRLALRIPDHGKARGARNLLIGFLVVIAVTAWSAVARIGGPGGGLLADLVGAGGCFSLVIGIAYIVLLNRFRRILCDMAEEGRKASGTTVCQAVANREQGTGA